jgi:hypothetical protein
MEELVKLVSEKTGLPNDKARAAVEVVVGYLKQRMPGSVGEHLNAIMSGTAGGGLTDKMKGMAGGGGGGFNS